MTDNLLYGRSNLYEELLKHSAGVSYGVFILATVVTCRHVKWNTNLHRLPLQTTRQQNGRGIMLIILSGGCTVAKRLIGSGCRLGWWVGWVVGWVY